MLSRRLTFATLSSPAGGGDGGSSSSALSGCCPSVQLLGVRWLMATVSLVEMFDLSVEMCTHNKSAAAGDHHRLFSTRAW